MNSRGAGWSIVSVVGLLVAGCGDDNNRLLDAGPEDLGSVEMDVPSTDLGSVDAGPVDTGLDVAGDRGTTVDAGATDAGSMDVSDVATPDRPDVAVADAGTPDAGTVDAASALDAGAVDAGAVDAGTADAGAVEAGTLDVGAVDSGTADAGVVDASSPRGTPVLDGIIGSDWPAGALVATNTIASAWGDANSLRSIRVAWDGTRLYLGIDGVVEASNAMLVFIDRDYVAGMTPTGAPIVSALSDGMGSLDNSISCNITEAPAGFGVDMVWGTRGMLSKTATELREAIGLREVGCTACRSDFRWTLGDSAVCVGGATRSCEVAIEWTALYGGAPPPVPSLGLFVRITNVEGNDLSNNQCLPEQATGDAPTVARRVLSFTPNL